MGIIQFFKGYRSCYDCGREGHKNSMAYVGVMDGLDSHTFVWMHQECGRKYVRNLGFGPFSRAARYAASFSNGLEDKTEE